MRANEWTPNASNHARAETPAWNTKSPACARPAHACNSSWKHTHGRHPTTLACAYASNHPSVRAHPTANLKHVQPGAFRPQQMRRTSQAQTHRRWPTQTCTHARAHPLDAETMSQAQAQTHRH
eukprot:1343554-Alexandrium_andersonii.AAC.1